MFYMPWINTNMKYSVYTIYGTLSNPTWKHRTHHIVFGRWICKSAIPDVMFWKMYERLVFIPNFTQKFVLYCLWERSTSCSVGITGSWHGYENSERIVANQLQTLMSDMIWTFDSKKPKVVLDGTLYRKLILLSWCPLDYSVYYNHSFE